MLQLIVDTAKQDDRIRAVILNGSRANPNAPRDFFQDFDVVYLVTDLTPFLNNLEWIKRFGDLMILQMPETMQDPPPSNDGCFAYLMQFIDGNRIDLGLCPLEKLDDVCRERLSVVLLDKDGLIGPLPPASECDYLPQPPTAKAFFDCCNEFWWVCPYVAKGLWRRELVYAKMAHEQLVREQLMKMLVWYIGVKTCFTRNPGKFGKHFDKVLEPELWQMLLETYADADYDRTWDALFTTCGLFRRTAQDVADHFGFDYPYEDDRRVCAHLRHVRALPQDAQEMYG